MRCVAVDVHVRKPLCAVSAAYGHDTQLLLLACDGRPDAFRRHRVGNHVSFISWLGVTLLRLISNNKQISETHQRQSRTTSNPYGSITPSYLCII